MGKVKIRKFDPVNYLKSENDLALYLEACPKEGGGGPAFVTAALGDTARARSMVGELADKAGMTKTGLYKALREDGNPSFSAVVKVIHAMGLEIHISPKRLGFGESGGASGAAPP